MKVSLMNVIVCDVYPVGLFRKRYIVKTHYTCLGLVVNIHRKDLTDVKIILTITGYPAFCYAGDLCIFIDEKDWGYEVSVEAEQRIQLSASIVEGGEYDVHIYHAFSE